MVKKVVMRGHSKKIKNKAENKEEKSPLPVSEKEKIIEIAEDISRSLVEAQYELFELIKTADLPEKTDVLLPRASAKKYENYILIKSNIYPPKINVHPSLQKGFQHQSTYGKVRDTWFTIIYKALSGMDYEPINDALVLIRYRRQYKRFDPPNHNAKFIIDALVYNNLLVDDSKDNLTLTVIGEQDSEEGTDIFIGDKQKFAPKFMELIGVKK